MSMKAEIEKIAREAAHKYHQEYDCGCNPEKLRPYFAWAIYQALRSDAVGFKEALEWIHGRACKACGAWDTCRGLPDCTCPCHTAESKLKELESHND